MNRLLTGAIGYLNSFLAIVLIVVGAVIGGAEMHLGGVIIGIIAGFIVAAIVCGVMALFIEMHSELTRIRAALERPQSRAGTA